MRTNVESLNFWCLRWLGAWIKGKKSWVGRCWICVCPVFLPLDNYAPLIQFLSNLSLFGPVYSGFQHCLLREWVAESHHSGTRIHASSLKRLLLSVIDNQSVFIWGQDRSERQIRAEILLIVHDLDDLPQIISPPKKLYSYFYCHFSRGPDFYGQETNLSDFSLAQNYSGYFHQSLVFCFFPSFFFEIYFLKFYLTKSNWKSQTTQVGQRLPIQQLQSKKYGWSRRHPHNKELSVGFVETIAILANNDTWNFKHKKRTSSLLSVPFAALASVSNYRTTKKRRHFIFYVVPTTGILVP